MDVLGPALADYGEADPSALVPIVTPDADEAVGLEDAPKVGADLIVRSRPETLGDANVGSSIEQSPALDEVPHDFAVDANPLNPDLLRRCVSHLDVDVRQSDVEVLHHPGVFIVVGDLKLDSQGAVRAGFVLADEAVGLEPTG